MRKLLANKFSLVVAIAIIVCVTLYLTFWRHVSSALAVCGVFLVMGIIGDMKKKNIIHWSPLITYLLLVVECSVKFALEDKYLRQDEGEKLTCVVIYGSIMLLTIPILYYNRSLN